MTWIKLEDTFATNPKVVAAGEDAAWLYIAGLGYCSANLTDGVIPKAVIPMLTRKRAPLVLASRLVSVGLWHEREHEYDVNQYLEHQRSRESVLGQRAQARQRKARSRVRHADVTGDVTDVSQRDTSVRHADVTLVEKRREELEVEKTISAVVPVSRVYEPVKSRRSQQTDPLVDRILDAWPDIERHKACEALFKLRFEANIADTIIDAAIGKAIEHHQTEPLERPLAWLSVVARDWFAQRQVAS